MNIVLKSDFNDYYDGYFDNQDYSKTEIIFNRNTCTLDKATIFSILSETYGLKTVEYGFIGDLLRNDLFNNYNSINKAIIDDHYAVDDEYCSFKRTDDNFIYYNNKVNLLTFEEALNLQKINSNFLCSRFVKNTENTLYRFIMVYPYFYWMEIKSDNWNCKENIKEVNKIERNIFDIDLKKFPKIIKENVANPILSIDFVKNFKTNQFYAVDFNTTPKLENTPFQENFSPDEIVNLIKEKIEINKDYGIILENLSKKKSLNRYRIRKSYI